VPEWFLITVLAGLNVGSAIACLVMTFLMRRESRRLIATRTLLLRLCVDSWMIRPWATRGTHDLRRIMLGDDP